LTEFKSIQRKRGKVYSNLAPYWSVFSLPNLNLSKRTAKMLYNAAIHIIKADVSCIERQNDREWFAALNINHLNIIAIIYFKPLCFLRVH